MAKARSTLNAALTNAAGKKTTLAKPGPVAVSPPEKEIVQAHFAPQVKDALRRLQYETRRNQKQLLGEAINLLCAKYNVPEPFSEEA